MPGGEVKKKNPRCQTPRFQCCSDRAATCGVRVARTISRSLGNAAGMGRGSERTRAQCPEHCRSGGAVGAAVHVESRASPEGSRGRRERGLRCAAVPSARCPSRDPSAAVPPPGAESLPGAGGLRGCAEARALFSRPDRVGCRHAARPQRVTSRGEVGGHRDRRRVPGRELFCSAAALRARTEGARPQRPQPRSRGCPGKERSVRSAARRSCGAVSPAIPVAGARQGPAPCGARRSAARRVLRQRGCRESFSSRVPLRAAESASGRTGDRAPLPALLAPPGGCRSGLRFSAGPKVLSHCAVSMETSDDGIGG